MTRRFASLATCLLALAGSLGGCGGAVSPSKDAGVTDAAADASDAAVDAFVEDLDMQATDFECLLRWQLVGHTRITNKLGHLAEAVAVAGSPDGGVMPVGTIVQIVPGEAMVKRRAGFSAVTRDWEFFLLSTSASGTTIVQRGTTNVANTFSGPCINCHSAAGAQFDLICGETHGCNPIPFTATQLESLQATDPRCP